MKTLRTLTAASLIVLSGIAQAATVESFAGGQLSSPPWSTGIGADASIFLSTPAPDGNYGIYLADATWSYNSSIGFHSGEVLSAWINPGPSSSDASGAQGGRLYLGFQSSDLGTYAITAASDTNQLLFQRSPDYATFVDGPHVGQSWNDQWYKLSLTWTSDTFTARLYDTNGVTLLNQLSTVLPISGATGIALRGTGGAAIATIDVSPVPEPSEAATLALGLGLLGLSLRRRIKVR